MNADEDVDLLPSKKSATKHGRRATPGSPEEIVGVNKSSVSPPEVPIRAKKTGGWADEGAKSAKSKSNIIEQERFQNQKSQETDDDIPVIPDIDDVADDPLNLPDVKIPNVTVKESTYKELDNQFGSEESNFGNLGDIDLSFLTSKLYPEKEVQLCTDVWTMESLYQDLSKQ